MATYTPEQFGEVMDQFLKGLPKVYAEAGFKAAQQLRAEIPVRIFNKGQAVDNSDIGKYSTTPTLVGAKSFPTKGAAAKVFGSKTKRRKLEWRRIGKNNLAVLEGGYKEIRNISGRRVDKVDLEFRGNLKKSIKLVSQKSKGIYTIIIKGDKNVVKARANEKRFKGAEDTIFAPTGRERRRANDIITDELTEYRKKFFN